MQGAVEDDPALALASLIHGVVHDVLHCNGFQGQILPEVVEMAVVGTGLGTLRNHVDLVAKTATYWDSTQWGVVPRPFLDIQALAYVNALAAWMRQERSPKWMGDMAGALRRPAQASNKFLQKTDDCFCQRSSSVGLLHQSQEDWWELVDSPSASCQINALRQLGGSRELTELQIGLLQSKLEDSNRAIVLHAIGATERLVDGNEGIESLIKTLRVLADHRDDEISAKSMCALTRMRMLNDICIEIATGMLESSRRHVVFSGAYGLATLDAIPEETQRVVDRAFRHALRACDYELVTLFAQAYHQWYADPGSHLRSQLAEDPELLQVALDALGQQNSRDAKIA